MSNIPGHYHAEGDPPDTVRYWDGSQWVGDPMPAPPTASTPPPPPPGGMAAAGATNNYGTLGVRFGAALIDLVIVVFVNFALVLALFGSSDGDGGFEAFAGTGSSILISALITAVYIGIIVQTGGTPGKLVLGLRITEEDGETPVTPRGAVMRSSPYIVGLIPFLGGLVTLGCAIAAIIMISNDAETRQSVYDRIGNTRVVRK